MSHRASPSFASKVSLGLCLAAVWVGGCARGPHLLPVDERTVIDRTEVEYPNDLQFTPYIGGLTAPVAIGFEADDERYKGSVLVAESGLGGRFAAPRIIGFLPTGESFPVYPRFTRIPILDEQFRIAGPISGMALAKGKIYVAHRDTRGLGVITALDYDGGHTTVIAGLPTLGDFGLTDIAIHPSNGRLYFGVGAATNSGVVGLDNWEVGWVGDHPGFCDQLLNNVKLNGFQFRTPNPRGGLFGGDDIVVTGPLQPFGALGKLRIPASVNGKPTAAIYSANIDGGDLRVEAHGMRLPRGLAFDEFGNLFATNNGMELRGTRPVKDDPDSVLRVPRGGQVWYGFPDYSADLRGIGDSVFQPPAAMVMRTGYPEIAALIDREGSGLLPPDRPGLLRGVFPSLSGAAKMVFVPDQPAEAFRPFRGHLIVALSGDRSPFANGGQKLVGPQGFRVMRIDLETKLPVDFVVNTQKLPASMIKSPGLQMERPIDVKFGPDGALYVVDYGRMEMKDGRERVESKTGQVYRLGPPAVPTTAPATEAEADGVRNFQE